MKKQKKEMAITKEITKVESTFSALTELEFTKKIYMPDKLTELEAEVYARLMPYTDGKQFSFDRYVDRLAICEEFGKHVYWQQCKDVFVLKAMCPHGKFMEALKAAKINERKARRMLQIAGAFMNFDKKFIEEMGPTKLLTILRESAIGAIAEMEEDGELHGADQDTLIKMSNKQLQEHLQSAVAEMNTKLNKVNLDLEHEKIKADKLFHDNEQLEKDKQNLQKELLEAKAGAPPEIPLPEFYHEVNNAAGALMALAIKLAAHAPDHADEHMATFCAQALARLEHEFNHCRKYLFNGVVDPVQLAEAGREKVAQLKNDSRFDFSKLND